MTDESNSRIRSALTKKTISTTGQSALEFQYNQEKLEQENRYRVQGDAFPEKLNKFNWGACILTPIWGLFNNSPIACLIILIALIPYIGWLFAMCFSIYCGIKGNEWAWNNKEWIDMTEFHAVQRNWAKAGVIIELVVLVVCVFSAMQIVNKVLDTSNGLY